MAEVVQSSIAAMCCSPVLASELPIGEAGDLAAALKVLADPVRLRLISLIKASPDGQALTRDLVEQLAVSQPTVSHHLGVLWEAGFLARERDGRQTRYSIVDDAFTAISQVLAPVRRPVDVQIIR